jgi:ribosome-associated toxin RatA of RatAB toxin-antitoxin module
MAVMRKTAYIDAPVDTVFTIVEAPENWPQYVPHVRKALDIRRTDRRVGDSFRLIYKVLGLTFDERLSVTAYERPNMYNMQVQGHMSGSQNWTFETQSGQTKVEIEVEYKLPAGPLGKALDALVLQRVNSKTIDQMFQNLNGMVGRPSSASLIDVS